MPRVVFTQSIANYFVLTVADSRQLAVADILPTGFPRHLMHYLAQISR